MPIKIKTIKTIKLIKLVKLAVLLSITMTGCTPLLLASVAGGASVAMDSRDIGRNADDKEIEFKVNQLLLKHFPKAHINNEVFNRNVLLTGEVSNKEQGLEAARLVWTISKVREVTNQLAIGEASNVLTRAKDGAITTAIKAKLIGEPTLKATDFIVTTERGNVYLQGYVSVEEGERASEIASQVPGVFKVVKVFDYIK